jgi:phosphodiesterase/alkaline phosphatase D-like protein
MALTDNLAELAARLERDTRGSPRTLARRRFLQGALALTAGHIVAASRPAGAQVVPPRFTAYPFSLGVASGARRVHRTTLSGRGAPEATPSENG